MMNNECGMMNKKSEEKSILMHIKNVGAVYESPVYRFIGVEV